MAWAVSHVVRNGLSDFVPRAFELEAMQNSRAELLASPDLDVDLSITRLRTFRRHFVPRPTGGYRLTTELDPIDGLFFGATAVELAPLVEGARVRLVNSGSMSGHVHVTSDGDLFASQSWQAFARRTVEYCQACQQFRYVVFTDIADFYGQIQHESVRRALLRASVPEQRVSSILNLIGQCSPHDGRGLPQGPTLSRLIAELILSSVDRFLARDSVPFLRYADDFRIFAHTAGEAERLLYRLSRMLFEEFGFTLSAPKSQIVAAEESRGFPQTPQEAASQRRGVAGASNWWIDFLQDDDGSKILDADPLPIQEARNVLAAGMETHPVTLTASVFRNLARLTPILRDVVDYLATDVTPEIQSWQRESMANLADSPSVSVPFVRWVLVSLLVARDILPAETVFDLALGGREDLGLRPALEAAHRFGKEDWIAAQLTDFSTLDPWDRRGLIYWSRSLDPALRAPIAAGSINDPLEPAVFAFAEATAKREAEAYKPMASKY